MPHLALYYFPECPFCKKVVDAIAELELEGIELRDKRANPEFERELRAATGRATVPCLRIESEGHVRWMHESNDIVQYLRQL